MNPQVSVIIPTKSRFELLRKSVTSADTQKAVSLEIIVVNDGGVPITASSLGTQHSLQIVNLPESLGAPRARNEGLKVARGKYIAFLDDDDTWCPNKVHSQVKAFEAHPEAAMVTSDYWIVGADGSRRIVQVSKLGYSKQELKFWNYVGGCSLPLLRREQVLSVGGFDPELKSCQDWDLWFRLAKVSGDILCVDVPSAEILQHEGDRISNRRVNRYHGWRLFVKKHRKEFSLPVRAYHQARFFQSVLSDVALVRTVTPFIGSAIHWMLGKVSGSKYRGMKIDECRGIRGQQG